VADGTWRSFRSLQEACSESKSSSTVLEGCFHGETALCLGRMFANENVSFWMGHLVNEKEPDQFRRPISMKEEFVSTFPLVYLVKETASTSAPEDSSREGLDIHTEGLSS
jgi:hypothetical protein